MPPNVYCDVAKEVQFDAGHRVPNHGSKCRNPHGHRYRVQVTCNGRIINEVGAPDEGMLVDFSALKDMMTKHIHDPLDHGFIVHKDDTVMLESLGVVDVAGMSGLNKNGWKVIVFPYVPTAENLARWCYEQLEPLIEGHFRGNMTLDRVSIWETPTSVAHYWGAVEDGL